MTQPKSKTWADAVSKDKARRCPACGAKDGMHFRPHNESREFRGHWFEFDGMAWVCASCNDFIWAPDAAHLEEDRWQAFRVRIMRVELGLSQREAGALIGGGTNAFQRYESGEQRPTTAMLNLLKLLVNDPSRLEELRKGAA
jgi:HTH-type transcriptional regulator/antitoxin MqsA